MMTLNGTQLKASTVLQAMVTGLLKSKDNSNFVLKMRTFGYVENKLCYGCCATLALAEMFGKGRSASEMMLGYAENQPDWPKYVYAYLSDVIKLEPLDVQDPSPIDILEHLNQLKYLERAVDLARQGEVSRLIGLLIGELNESFNDRWDLEDEDWEEQLPVVESTIAEMIAAGY